MSWFTVNLNIIHVIHSPSSKSFYPLDLCLHLIGYERLSAQDFHLSAIKKCLTFMMFWSTAGLTKPDSSHFIAGLAGNKSFLSKRPLISSKVPALAWNRLCFVVDIVEHLGAAMFWIEMSMSQIADMLKFSNFLFPVFLHTWPLFFIVIHWLYLLTSRSL